jgi:hypothetical protein
MIEAAYHADGPCSGTLNTVPLLYATLATARQQRTAVPSGRNAFSRFMVAASVRVLVTGSTGYIGDAWCLAYSRPAIPFVALLATLDASMEDSPELK